VRYDTGVPLGYLQAVVQLACQRDDLGPEFRRWLAEFLAGAGAGAGGGPAGGGR
jgi:UTP--glucose-1-phosphate uridylyltransferase